jgi:hypothetical protein
LSNVTRERQRARAERTLLLARYDSGAISVMIFTVIKGLEVGIAWIEHKEHTS